MAKPPIPRTTHRHRACVRCEPVGGYYSSDPDHEECTGQCPGPHEWNKDSETCEGGSCGCECRRPLDRNEIMQLREAMSFLRKVSRE